MLVKKGFFLVVIGQTISLRTWTLRQLNAK